MPQGTRTASQILASYRRMKPENRHRLAVEDAWTIAQDPKLWTIGVHLTMRCLQRGATGVTWAHIRTLFERKGRQAVAASHLLPVYAEGSPARKEWVRSWFEPEPAKKVAGKPEQQAPKPPAAQKAESPALPPPVKVTPPQKGPPPKKGSKRGFIPLHVSTWGRATPPSTVSSPFACLAPVAQRLEGQPAAV